MRVRDGSPRAHSHRAFFEISSDTLGEVETRAVMLADAADVRLERLLELPHPSVIEVQKHLYFASLSLADYYADWRATVGVNCWRLVKNLCYFKLVPGLLALHKAKEQHQTAESECVQCIRVLGQKQRQEDLFTNTLRKIEENKSALRELSKGKRPFIAGGAIHHQAGSRQSSRAKGVNPSQRPPKPMCRETELSLRLKQEISQKTLAIGVLKAWSVYSAMSVNLRHEVEVVQRRHLNVMGQFCIAVWSRFAELRKEERVALRVVRGELAATRKERVFQAWRDAIAVPQRRAALMKKTAAVVASRSKTRLCIAWRAYALDRRGKRQSAALAAALNSRVATLRVIQRWRSVVILAQTLPLRLKSLASGENLVPSSEDIEAATELEIVQGIQWQREALSSQRAAWKESKAMYTDCQRRISLLLTGISQGQRSRLLAKWNHLGEHRSLQELNSRTISLVVEDATIPCFSVVKLTPAPLPEAKSIDDPLKRSVHLKYAKQQRAFAKPMPVRKPPLPTKSVTSSPRSSVPPSPETRPRQALLVSANLLDRVTQDSRRLVLSLHDLSRVPYSFLTFSAQSALKDRRLPLKQLLLERWRHVLKAKIVCEWKQVSMRRKLAVVLTIRYAVRLGRHFLLSLKRFCGSRVRNVDEVRSRLVAKRVLNGWEQETLKAKDSARRYYLQHAIRGWSQYLIAKAEKLTKVLRGEEQYCRMLQRKALAGLRERSLQMRRPRQFLTSLLLHRYFQAWRSQYEGKIRVLTSSPA